LTNKCNATDEYLEDEGMKRLIIGAAGILALSVIALVSAYIYGNVARDLGWEIVKIDSPEAAFLMTVGFGAMYLIPISAVILVVLLLVAIVRAYFPREEAHPGEAPE
jgi:heme/copper-type cytochrome/quinol oxidase subunit 2